MNRQKLLTILLLSLSAIVLASVLVWVNANQSANQPIDQSKHQDQASQTEPARTEIRYTAEAGITSLEQLKQSASDVVTEESQYGEYVDSIGGLKGGDDGKYWSFYIDGAMSDVGASSYTQKGGEEIVWKFQKL